MYKEKIELAENIVCSMYHIKKLHLVCESRMKEYVEARFLLWRFLSDELGLTSVAIAARYNKDHSSVLHGIHRAKTQPLVVEYVRFMTKFRACEEPVYNLGNSCGMRTVAI